MKEFVNGFKVDLEYLMEDWYESLECLVNDTLFDMSVFEGDVEEHYELLQEIMIEVLQERMAKVFGEDGESN